jgi:hypothetical protein
VRKLHLLLLPAVLLALGFGLVACGGSDESDEDAVIETIETSAMSSDPADCKALSTIAFLEQTEFEQGDAAIESCEKSADETENDPDSVEVSKVQVDGSNATANVAFVGGPYDGQVLSVALVEEDGTWKMDELTSFVTFDQDHLAQSFQEGVTSGSNALPDEVGACLGEELSELSKAEFEDLILGGEPQPLVELVESCQQQ